MSQPAQNDLLHSARAIWARHAMARPSAAVLASPAVNRKVPAKPEYLDTRRGASTPRVLRLGSAVYRVNSSTDIPNYLTEQDSAQ